MTFRCPCNSVNHQLLEVGDLKEYGAVIVGKISVKGGLINGRTKQNDCLDHGNIFRFRPLLKPLDFDAMPLCRYWRVTVDLMLFFSETMP